MGMIRSKVILITFFLFFVNAYFLQAQEATQNKWQSLLEDYKIKTNIGFQLWSTYTLGQELFDDSANSYIPVDNRFNSEIRRSRLTISGQPYANLKFKLTASLDLIGRDALSATQGGANNGNSGQFGLWNMYLQWKPDINNDFWNLTVGFQPPQIGRESITAALRSTSFEKSWSQNYLRRNIVGTGPGRALGINLGGQKIISEKLAFSYDIGIFSPQRFSNIANSQGVNANPLLAGRLAFYIGQPESNSYTTGHKVNYFGSRQGLTIALAASKQGQSGIFDNNEAVGVDWLLNLGMLNLDGEWTFFQRSKSINSNEDISTKSNGGYIRLGYNIKLENERYIEPVIMFVQYNGPLNLAEQQNAIALNAFAGTDRILDFGINYHLNKNLKLSFTYTKNNGDLGESPEGVTFNNFYANNNSEAIKRGDLIGLGIVAIF